MDPLKLHLKKVFLSLRSDMEIRRECLSSTETMWDNLINTAEQYHCSLRALESNANLAIFLDFPDAVEKLQTKLVSSMSLLFDRIQKKMLALEKISKTVHSGWQSTWELLEKQRRSVDVADTVKDSPTEPSVSDMLLWLQRLNRLIQQDYAERVWMLESADFENEELMLAYRMSWSSKEKILQQEIDTVFAYLHFWLGNG